MKMTMNSFPRVVTQYISPYPTVDIVTTVKYMQSQNDNLEALTNVTNGSPEFSS